LCALTPEKSQDFTPSYATTCFTTASERTGSAQAAAAARFRTTAAAANARTQTTVCVPGSVLHAGPCRTEVLAGLDDAFGHALLRGLAEGARIVELLVADFAVDLEHAVVVAEHVLDDRTGERVLGVGVDVHLHHSVADSLGDLLRARSRAAVEDEVERLVLADLSADLGLDLTEQFGPEPDIAGLVDAVDVSEGQ